MWLVASTVVCIQARLCSFPFGYNSAASPRLSPSLLCAPPTFIPALSDDPVLDISLLRCSRAFVCPSVQVRELSTRRRSGDVCLRRNSIACHDLRERRGRIGFMTAAGQQDIAAGNRPERSRGDEKANENKPGKMRRRSRSSAADRLQSVSFDSSELDLDSQLTNEDTRTNLRLSESQGATEGRRFARHDLYLRRKHPPSALCMPRHQRPQGCAPLLSETELEDPAINQVQPDVSATQSRSDLPCVAEGKCPLPAFRCPKGHVWETRGGPVCFYCPVCADSRVTPLKLGPSRMKQTRNLKVIQRMAEARGGTCLSTSYLGMHGKLRFRCDKGHEWLSSPSNLTYKNTWCPTCGDSRGSARRRLTSSDMRYTARQFGGEFMSTEYMGANVKHEWRCSRGHHFWQTPNNMRRAEGGRRTASFCKECNVIDRDVVKASVLAGYSAEEAKATKKALENTGAMPVRRHFMPRKRKKTVSRKRE